MVAVLILGGTGLLGQHTAAALLADGAHVTSISRHLTGQALPGTTNVLRQEADLATISEQNLTDLMRGYDAVVQAFGPDERKPHPAPVSKFYEQHLVEATVKVARCARAAGVPRLVVLGSYFVTWARMHPGFERRHPYVAARQRQAAAAIQVGGGLAVGGTDVAILEIPYVFGTVPGQVPSWREWLFDRLLAMPVTMYPNGGTSVVTAAQVGAAAAAAARVGRHGAYYPLADEQLTWRALLGRVLPMLGRSPRVITVPRLLAEPTARSLGRSTTGDGLEPGITPRWLMRDIMYQHMFVDPAAAWTELGMPRGGITEAVRDTVAASYPEGVPGRRVAARAR